MTILIVFAGFLAALAVAAALGLTPDTHTEVTQHGNFDIDS